MACNHIDKETNKAVYYKMVVFCEVKNNRDLVTIIDKAGLLLIRKKM